MNSVIHTLQNRTHTLSDKLKRYAADAMIPKDEKIMLEEYAKDMGDKEFYSAVTLISSVAFAVFGFYVGGSIGGFLGVSIGTFFLFSATTIGLLSYDIHVAAKEGRKALLDRKNFLDLLRSFGKSLLGKKIEIQGDSAYHAKLWLNQEVIKTCANTIMLKHLVTSWVDQWVEIFLEQTLKRRNARADLRSRSIMIQTTLVNRYSYWKNGAEIFHYTPEGFQMRINKVRAKKLPEGIANYFKTTQRIITKLDQRPLAETKDQLLKLEEQIHLTDLEKHRLQQASMPLLPKEEVEFLEKFEERKNALISLVNAHNGNQTLIKDFEEGFETCKKNNEGKRAIKKIKELIQQVEEDLALTLQEKEQLHRKTPMPLLPEEKNRIRAQFKARENRIIEIVQNRDITEEEKKGYQTIINGFSQKNRTKRFSTLKNRIKQLEADLQITDNEKSALQQHTPIPLLLKEKIAICLKLEKKIKKLKSILEKRQPTNSVHLKKSDWFLIQLNKIQNIPHLKQSYINFVNELSLTEEEKKLLKQSPAKTSKRSFFNLF